MIKACQITLSETELVGRVLTRKYGHRQIRWKVVGFNRGPVRPIEHHGAVLLTGRPGNTCVILERLDRGARTIPPGSLRVWSKRWCFDSHSGYYLED